MRVLSAMAFNYFQTVRSFALEIIKTNCYKWKTSLLDFFTPCIHVNITFTYSEVFLPWVHVFLLTHHGLGEYSELDSACYITGFLFNCIFQTVMTEKQQI